MLVPVPTYCAVYHRESSLHRFRFSRLWKTVYNLSVADGLSVTDLRQHTANGARVAHGMQHAPALVLISGDIATTYTLSNWKAQKLPVAYRAGMFPSCGERRCVDMANGYVLVPYFASVVAFNSLGKCRGGSPLQAGTYLLPPEFDQAQLHRLYKPIDYAVRRATRTSTWVSCRATYRARHAKPLCYVERAMGGEGEAAAPPPPPATARGVSVEGSV